jgi:hypothetical protein
MYGFGVMELLARLTLSAESGTEEVSSANSMAMLEDDVSLDVGKDS